MPLLFTNATVGVSRLSGSAYAPVSGLSAVSAYVGAKTAGAPLRLLGTQPPAMLTLKWDPEYIAGVPSTPIVIGDRITGWPGTSAALYVASIPDYMGGAIAGLDYFISDLALLPSTCSILRTTRTPDGYGGTTASTSTIATGVPCTLAGSVGTEQEQAGRITAVTEFISYVPLGTDIQPADQVQIGSGVYEVRAILGDTGATAWSIPVRIWRVQ